MTNERKEVCEHVEVTLKEHFESRFTALDKAITLATTVVDKRLGELNELRKEVLQDRGQFVSREFYETKHSALQSEIDTLKNTFSRFAITAGILVTLIQIAEPIAFYLIFHK